MTRLPSFPLTSLRSIALAGSTVALLSACDDMGQFNPANLLPARDDSAQTSAGGPSQAAGIVERDVEAPEVFAASEAGLWDGRPSLGGVWVAHPDVDEPERVLIRNETNVTTVVGALFRRERETPGPRIQISSDAAEALGILAGAPVALNVVALRKEVVEVAPAADQETDAAAAIAEAELDPAPSAEAASNNTDGVAVGAAGATTPAIQSSLPERMLERPYLQAGIFNREENAKRAVGLLEEAGVTATARSTKSSGRDIWRVVVGPAATIADRNAALEKVRAAGFDDAYPVRN
jgi:cell division septation protein DedD